MGAFDLPKGNLELCIDGEWKSVVMADDMSDAAIASYAVQWSEWGHAVTGARYNGNKRPIPNGKLVVRYVMPADKMPDTCQFCKAEALCPCNVTKADGKFKKPYIKRRHAHCPLTFVPLA